MDDGALRIEPYRDAADLRRMQDVLVQDFDSTDWRIGDLAWAVREHSHLDLTLRVRLLHDDDQLIGWSWVRGRGLIEVDLHSAHRSTAAYSRLLDEADAVVSAMRAAGDDPGDLRVWVPDGDDALVAAVTGRGFARGQSALQVNRRESLDEIPEPRALPDGWSYSAVDTEARTIARVECHRAAFAPSSLTLPAYQRSQAAWPYRAELDRVIVDAEGGVVAACTAWFDEANGEGLFEPVATRPDEQGRGYGRAVCIDALRMLRDAGARRAQVACLAGAVACRTYAAVGFEPVLRVSEYARPATSP